jgi:hypothetical protein
MRLGDAVSSVPSVTDVMQGLWVGRQLSVMEQVSIRSFLANGHAYHLYTYDDVAGVPDGAVLKDGNDILPASRIFRYRDHDSYAGFANFFRYKLLLERGGWWVDTDLVCLKPFTFSQAYVFSSERDGPAVGANCGVIKAPAGSELMAYAWQTCASKDPQSITWGETGPVLMRQVIAALGLEEFIQAPDVFCPVDFADWHRLIERGFAPRASRFSAVWDRLQPGRRHRFDASPIRLTTRSNAVHLWNELWRRAGFDKNEAYAPDSLYEYLKARYLAERADT